jgi:ribosomal protein L37AE/L43A
MNKKFLQNVYGLDKFSKLLLFIGALFLISWRGSIFGLTFGFIIIVYAIWRTISHNMEARRRELSTFESYVRDLNYKLRGLKFKGIFGNWTQGIRTYFDKMKDKKYHVIVACPKCSQKLRLPKKKGNIIVTCTKCGAEFKIKT